MSTLDSAVNALASSAIVDVYKPFVRRNASEGHYLRVSRLAVVLFGGLIVAVAFLLNGIPGGKLWLGFKVTGFTYGALLGVFLLGVTTRRGHDRANALAMVSSAALLVGLTLADAHDLFRLGRPLIAWPWYVVVGAAWTWIFGFLAGGGREGSSVRSV